MVSLVTKYYGLYTRNKVNLYKYKNFVIPWLFVLPGIIFTFWLRYYTIIKAFYISMFDYSIIDPPGKFTGFKNYYDVLIQSSYWNAWKNTFIFLILTFAITFAIPIIQAVFLNEIIRGRSLFMTIYLVTTIIPVSVNVILWKWIWQPDFGIANGIMAIFKIPPQLWLSDILWTKFCIIFPGIIGGGVTVLIYLAAIMGISTEVVEAGKMDGCSGWKRIFYIVLPNIRFVIFLYFVMTAIFCMQIMVAPFQYTAGGPAGVSTSMGIYIYNTAMNEALFGRSNAASVILFVVIAVMTIIQMKWDKSETN